MYRLVGYVEWGTMKAMFSSLAVASSEANFGETLLGGVRRSREERKKKVDNCKSLCHSVYFYRNK